MSEIKVGIQRNEGDWIGIINIAQMCQTQESEPCHPPRHGGLPGLSTSPLLHVVLERHKNSFCSLFISAHHLFPQARKPSSLSLPIL